MEILFATRIKKIATESLALEEDAMKKATSPDMALSVMNANLTYYPVKKNPIDTINSKFD